MRNNDILLNGTFIVSSTPKQNFPVSCEISSKYLPKRQANTALPMQSRKIQFSRRIANT